MVSPDVKLTIIASSAHEAVRAFCLSNNLDAPLPWEDLSQSDRITTLNGVIWNLQNPDCSREDQHERWCQEMIGAGWSFAEGGIDHNARTHDCLRPYNELPEEHQAKDNLFISVVRSLNALLNQDEPKQKQFNVRVEGRDGSTETMFDADIQFGQGVAFINQPNCQTVFPLDIVAKVERFLVEDEAE